MRFRSVLAALGVAGVMAGATSPALADPSAPNETLLQQGVALREQGKDADALAIFKQAYALAPTAEALAQIGVAEQALGMWVDAERDVAKALAATDDPWIASHVPPLEGALATIRAHLGTIEIRSSTPGATLYVDGALAGKVADGAAFRVEAGNRNIELRADGMYPSSRAVAVAAGGTARETIDLQPLPSAPPPVVRHGEDSHPQGATHERATPSDGTTQRSIGWVLVATSAALAASGVAGIVGRNVELASYNDDPSCPGLSAFDQPPLCQSKLSTAQTWTVVSIVSFVGAGVIATGGLTLVLTAPKSSAAASTSVVCAPFLGISCMGRF